MYAQQQAAAQAAAAAQKQRQKMLNKNRSALEGAFNTKIGALKSNYDSTVGQLGNVYSSSKEQLKMMLQNLLEEAYVNKMLTQKNLGQQLSAQGLSGGATESTLACRTIMAQFKKRN